MQKFQILIFWERPLYEISEYAFNGKLWSSYIRIKKNSHTYTSLPHTVAYTIIQHTPIHTQDKALICIYFEKAKLRMITGNYFGRYLSIFAVGRYTYLFSTE